MIYENALLLYVHLTNLCEGRTRGTAVYQNDSVGTAREIPTEAKR